MVKWGSTECTQIKWGSTVCTVVKWGSTIVFPTNNGFDVNSGTFVAPIASGLYYFPKFGSSTTQTTGTALTGDKTNLAYDGTNRTTFVSKSALTAAQWNALKQIRIVAKYIVYDANMSLISDLYFNTTLSNMNIYI